MEEQLDYFATVRSISGVVDLSFHDCVLKILAAAIGRTKNGDRFSDSLLLDRRVVGLLYSL